MAMRPSQIAKDFAPAPNLCKNCACQPVCEETVYQPNECKNFSPKVIRCKECKWYREGRLFAPNKFCFRLMHPTENRRVGYNFGADDYCSYGERRECGDSGKE